MSTTAEKTPVKVGPHNPIALEQHSLLRSKEGGDPLGLVGVKNRESGPKLINQVFINCLSGRENRNSVVCLPVHVIPLERAMQRKSGGDVKPIPGMAPFIKQEQGMTKLEVAQEIVRLHGNDDHSRGPTSQGAYLYFDDDGKPHNLFHEVYGGSNGQPITLVERMMAVEKAWEELRKTARDEMRTITVDDLNALIAVCSPPDEVDALSALDAAMAKVQKSAADQLPRPAGEVDEVFVEYLVQEHGVNEEVGRAFAGQVSAPQGPDHTLTDEQWKQVPGVGGHTAKRAKLMRCHQEYADKNAAAG
jgi:hypothetical protein